LAVNRYSSEVFYRRLLGPVDVLNSPFSPKQRSYIRVCITDGAATIY